MSMHTRGKKILEQLSRPRFFRVLKFPALIPTCLARRKGREISESGKNRGLESCSNIFLPLRYSLRTLRTQAKNEKNFGLKSADIVRKFAAKLILDVATFASQIKSF